MQRKHPEEEILSGKLAKQLTVEEAETQRSAENANESPTEAVIKVYLPFLRQTTGSLLKAGECGSGWMSAEKWPLCLTN